MRTHTPGPWHVDAEPSVCRGIYASHGCTVIASVHSANAALIAAAPELLSAARAASGLLEVFRGGGGCDPRDAESVCAQIAAAIVRAERGAS